MGIRVACIVLGLGLASACWSATPFDGDIAGLAARSPRQIVSMQVDFVATATPQSIADLVFAEHLPGLSAFGKHYSSRATYQTFSFSFSDQGPPKEEQLARANCQTAVSSQPFSDPGPDAPLPLGARSTFMQASVVMTADQAKRWSDSHPALIEKIGRIMPLDAKQTDRSRQLMRRVLSVKTTVVGVAKLPPGCEQYMTIRQ
jgi:hypothetical protein